MHRSCYFPAARVLELCGRICQGNSCGVFMCFPSGHHDLSNNAVRTNVGTTSQTSGGQYHSDTIAIPHIGMIQLLYHSHYNHSYYTIGIPQSVIPCYTIGIPQLLPELYPSGQTWPRCLSRRCVVVGLSLGSALRHLAPCYAFGWDDFGSFQVFDGCLSDFFQMFAIS